MKNTAHVLATLVALLLVHAANAQTIIFTESFENPDTPNNDDPLGTPSGWTWVVKSYSQNQGLFNYANATDGAQVFFGYAGQPYIIRTTETNLSETVELDATYTLTLDYQGYRSDRTINIEVRLLAIDGGGVTELASDFRSLSSGHGLYGTTWGSLSVTNTPAANSGERLAIELNNYSSETSGAYVDSLVLEKIDPPPPTGAVLVIR